MKQCIDQIEVLVNSTPKPTSHKLSTPKKSSKLSSSDDEEDTIEATPTKVLDVAKQN